MLCTRPAAKSMIRGLTVAAVPAMASCFLLSGAGMPARLAAGRVSRPAGAAALTQRPCLLHARKVHSGRPWPAAHAGMLARNSLALEGLKVVPRCR